MTDEDVDRLREGWRHHAKAANHLQRLYPDLFEQVQRVINPTLRLQQEAALVVESLRLVAEKDFVNERTGKGLPGYRKLLDVATRLETAVQTPDEPEMRNDEQ